MNQHLSIWVMIVIGMLWSVTVWTHEGLEIQKPYQGEKISLNFQDIELRAVLQILADFSHFNIIASDSVKGNITLRLQEVPWDEVLDILLKSAGLGKRLYGNVILIGAQDEMLAREKMELEGQKQLQELGSMRSELIQIHYAKAEDLAILLKDKAKSFLTSRGTVSVDKRTNILLVQDISNKIAEIRHLIQKLDVPVRQVEIATQIITADHTVESALGLRFGTGAPVFNMKSDLKASHAEGLFSDLGIMSGGSIFGAAGAAPAKIGLAVAKLPNGTLLDLELQALEYEAKSKTIAKPRLVTLDQNKAVVEKGVDIPYLESSSSGATSVSYKTAALKLEVTPQITPDNKIALEVIISNDTQGQNVAAGPVVNTNRLQTRVLAEDGETIVLGGVLSVVDNKQSAKVPFLSGLPLIGGLFKNQYTQYSPKELIIFLTPRIIQAP